jgi:proline iminopeptidase
MNPLVPRIVNDSGSPDRRWLAAGLALVMACSAPAAPKSQAPVATAAPLVAGERWITVSDGARLYLHVAGNGPVCMFIHGGPGQDSLSFEQMGGSALEAFSTMVYLDQRGSGKSPDAGDYHLDRVVQDFDEVRTQLGVDKLCLIAHSFGGILAVAYARRYPTHVSQLVMANATLQFLAPRQQRMQVAFINQLLHREGKPVPADDHDEPGVQAAWDDAWSALMHSDQGYRVLTPNLATVQRMNQIESSYPRSQGFGTAVIEQRAALPEYYQDYAPMSAQIAQPVLVLTSAKDYAVGPDEYKRFQFPHPKVVVLDTGHVSYNDATEAFAAAIRDFVTSP